MAAAPLSVMLVDDDYITTLFNKKILETTRFAQNIVAHNSPVDAIEYLKEKHPITEMPDLIFLDLRMPEMDGFGFLDALDILDKVKEGPKVVMLSSAIDDEDRDRARKNNRVLTVLEKPLSESKLKQIAFFQLEGSAK